MDDANSMLQTSNGNPKIKTALKAMQEEMLQTSNENAKMDDCYYDDDWVYDPTILAFHKYTGEYR